MKSVREIDPVLMSREQFLAWTAERPSGKFERIDGIVFAMAPERVARSERKSLVARLSDRRRDFASDHHGWSNRPRSTRYFDCYR